MLGYVFSTDDRVFEESKAIRGSNIHKRSSYTGDRVILGVDGIFRSKACYSDFPHDYNGKLNMYLLLNSFPDLKESVEKLNQYFKYIHFDIFSKIYFDKKEFGSPYGGKESKLFIKEDKTEDIAYIVKITILHEEELIPEIKYFLTYMGALIIRMFSFEESYCLAYDCLTYKRDDILDYLIKINNRNSKNGRGFNESQTNTNHLLSENIIDTTIFKAMNDKEFLENNLEILSGTHSWGAYKNPDKKLKVGNHIFQTSVFKSISENYKEK